MTVDKIPHTVKPNGKLHTVAGGIIPTMSGDPERSARLRRARIEAGFDTPTAAAIAHRWNPNTYKSNENGNAPFSFKKAKDYAEAFGVRPEWLYDGLGSMTPGGLVPIIGRAGANPEGEVLFASGDSSPEMVPAPPGGTDKAVAILVVGDSMRGYADDGSLIYFEDQFTPPTPEMMGHPAVVETFNDEVLVKILHRGSQPGLYDLVSHAGPIMRDARVRWAAPITAIIPPHKASKIRSA